MREKGASRSICMVCDFFYPQLGGVENHIWSLSQRLLARGHKVVVVTHAYGRRQGVRYMANGLKVYYLPLKPIVAGTIMPSFIAMYPLLRQILIRERIAIVHGHQATSVMTEEAIVFGKVMGYKVVFTDHSLFGFDDAAGLHLNKYTKYSFAHVDHAVAVSNTCRENLVLRSCLAPELISVIPNAVDVSRFTPDPSLRRPMNKINIVIISRLTYRKGIDLIAPVIVAVAQRHPRVHFIIGGDGPKRLLLEEMRERHQLYDRVELLGAVPHDKVRDVLCRGHIFLNCSLTDSFCIAILEAAACGLTVVSTRVGGIPEVLPEDMVALAEPNVSDLTRAVLFATTRVGSLKPWANHERIRNMYDWSDVSERTEAIYDLVMEAEDRKLLDRFLDFRVVGSFGQLVSCILETLLHLLWLLLEFLQPAAGIELAPNWPAAPSSASPERGGSNLDRSR